ncbi:MAG TPA: hypothetical protein VGI16_06985 [Candidatus Acidoferrum sp.]|jgi:hypothetical protein
MTAQDYKAPESVGRLQQRSLVAAIVGIVLCVVGAIHSPAQFFHSYLFAFLLILGASLGSLGLLMLHHLTSGHWGIMIRRVLEAATRTLVLVAILFIPIVVGMKYIYGAWLNAPASGESSIQGFQKSYLTEQGFILRAIVYFAVWLTLVFLLNKWSRQQDVDQENRLLRRRLKLLSGPGIVLYVFGLGFASIDWAMSLSPHWFSTIYGFIFVAGQLITAMGLAIIILAMLSRTEPIADVVKPKIFGDLGGLLLAFLMLWAYFSFSQLLIIWSGNQPDEIPFFEKRLHGQFAYVSVFILIFHFFVPFFLLLSRDIKRNYRQLPKVAMWLIFMRIVDLYWYTRPEFSLNGVPITSAIPNISDFGAVLALGGLWLHVFAGQLKRMPLLPLGEPKLAEVVAHDEH